MKEQANATHTVTHIAKPLKLTLKPKFGKECVCPTAHQKWF